jgi:hypothetical protein
MLRCGAGSGPLGAGAAQPYRAGDPGFLRLEYHFFTTGISGYKAKARIVRGVVRAYIAKPLYYRESGK